MADTRQTVYTNEQPSSAKFLQMQRDLEKGLAQFVADVLGNTNSFFTGLAATPGSGLSVNLGPGAVYQDLAIDPTAWSTLGADTTTWPLQGILPPGSSTNVVLTPPAMTAGQSVNILIECQIQVLDSAAVNTNFYNSANPANPIVQSKSPSRKNSVVFQTKNGTPATTGSQTSPSADAGWIPLYIVTVDQGESSLVSGDIVLATGAPQFYGFVQVNPNGNTPVYLSPASQQTGYINIGSNTGSTLGKSLTINDASGSNVPSVFLQDAGSTVASLAYASAQPNILTLAVGSAPFKFKSDGTADFSNGHAMTDGDPGPSINANVTMLGGKVASDYALASGNYVTLYAGAPTLGSGNAGVTGYLQSGVATGTAPLVVASTTQVTNLNASYLAGNAAGNNSGNIPISNGTLCTNLNAQFLGGLASSAYQLAGNYAQMGVTNTGDFPITGKLSSTGGTGSTQILAAYAATNAFGINGGNQVAYIQAPNYPLGLIGSSIRTNAPLYVGDGVRQNVYLQDLVASGVVRQGLPMYRVTKLSSFQPNSGPFPVGTTGAVDLGYWVSPTGNITLSLPGAYTFDFRMVITLSTSLAVNFNGRYNDSFSIWVDGVNVYTGSGDSNISDSYTLSAGTHNVDIIYGADGIAGDDKLDLFGWIPYPSGAMAAAITSILPG